MTDIVERLRGKPVRHDYLPEADRQEAAGEIERLRADNERLRALVNDCSVCSQLNKFALKDTDEGLPTADDVRGILKDTTP